MKSLLKKVYTFLRPVPANRVIMTAASLRRAAEREFLTTGIHPSMAIEAVTYRIDPEHWVTIDLRDMRASPKEKVNWKKEGF